MVAYVGGFTMLSKMLAASGLDEMLRDAGPYTLFAPTDAAFAKLSAEAIDSLLADRDRLASTLTYHVLADRLTVASIFRTGGSNPRSVNGLPLSITTRNGKVFVDGTMVVRADLAGSNGVIHGIAAVMTPRAMPVPTAH